MLRIAVLGPPARPALPVVGLISPLAALRPRSGEGVPVPGDAEGTQGEAAQPRGQRDLDDAFRVHASDVRRLCRRMLGDAASAEDAAADVFLRVRQARDAYDPGREPRPWLLSIAAHHCIDLLRRRATERRLFADRDLDPRDLADRGPSPLHHALRAEERAAVGAAIDALPPKYRLPLVLRHFADLDYDAIAELLGLTRNQVGTLLFRARRRLRERLREVAP